MSCPLWHSCILSLDVYGKNFNLCVCIKRNSIKDRKRNNKSRNF